MTGRDRTGWGVLLLAACTGGMEHRPRPIAAGRVLAALREGDDAATLVLVVKFHEAWNPKEGSKGLPAPPAPGVPSGSAFRSASVLGKNLLGPT